MVPVELVRILIDERKNEQAVVLREKDGSRQVPIVIGFPEAASIQMKVSGTDMPRPLTHDLIVSLVNVFGASVEKVVVDDVVDGTFFAKLHVKAKDGHKTIIDCRPSDAIALSVRLHFPIFVDEKVFSSMPS
jgi:bifunctional DNase/RNase